MDMQELLGKYRRLREDLEDAYARIPWDTSRIDLITAELTQLERTLAGCFAASLRRDKTSRQRESMRHLRVPTL